MFMKIRLKLLLTIFVATVLTSCDKNFEEINTDPTQLTNQNMQYKYLFTSAQLYTAGNADGYSAGIWESSMSYASTMIQQFSSTSGFWYGDKYIYNETYNSSFWRYQYPTAVKAIVDVMENIKGKANEENFYQITRILKAYLFQRLTDAYGDIPYSEAGIGFTQSKTRPKYDAQADIYADLLKELDEAATSLDDALPNSVGDADAFYGGDVAKWKKFAYSEMLRLAMRLSKVDAAMAQQWVSKAVQGGVMESNDDNAICTHAARGTNPLSNPVGLQLASREPGSYRLSQRFVEFLQDNDDPRLEFLATVTTDPSDGSELGDNDPGIQLGQPNGYDRSGAATDITNAPNWPGDQNNYSVVNRTTFAREDAPTFILTYAETQLLLAEATQLGWINGTAAATYYRNGVEAAILQLNQAGATLTDDQASDYVDAHPYVAANGIRMINEQYWVATFADWLESWFNWRRSGFPVLTPVNYQGNVTNGTIPRRFTYPLDEAVSNPQNYLAAIANIANGDKMTSRVWWDVQ